MEPEMPRTRRNFSPAQKVNIIREHLIERVPISDLCEKHQIQVDTKVVFFRTISYVFRETFFVKGRDYSPLKIVEVDHAFLKPLFEEVLRTMRYEGFSCFNYKLVNGQPRLFEVNPRFGGSLTYFLKDALFAYHRAICRHHPDLRCRIPVRPCLNRAFHPLSI
jgi:hypothetical protein